MSKTSGFHSERSIVWYPKKAFDEAGYTVPRTWAELMALTQQIADGNRTAWCIGIESGNATGWPATDWIEEIMLRTASLDEYNQWILGDRPFTDPKVRDAIQRMSDIWFNPQYVYGGRSWIVNTNFHKAPEPMFYDPPGCWLHKQSNFIIADFPPDKNFGTDYDVFYLPPIDPQYGKPVLGAGDIVAMFNDRPEVRAVMQYLTLGESLRVWLNAGGTFAAADDTLLSWYDRPEDLKIEEEILSEATIFVFDASDQMPEVVGQGTFWSVMKRYVAGEIELDQALAEIQQSWPTVNQ
jgi:alpha-glucoside transport system substrate-binding protein